MSVFTDSSLLVYLNVRLPEHEARLVEDLWLDLISNHEVYTNILALDETIYVSTRKYKVPLEDTLEFIDRAVVPYVDIISIGLDEYLKAKEYMVKYRLKPSDAIHLATIHTHGIQAIASEDKDFDRTDIKRIWIRR